MMWVVLLLTSATDLGERSADGVRCRLAVEIPREGAGPGLARAYFLVSADGPAAMEIEGPRLEDALAAWQVKAAASSWAEGRLGRSLELQQQPDKRGAAGLPSIVLRVRGGPEAAWQELRWDAPLHDPADVAPPEELPPLPPSGVWPWVVGIALLAVLVMLPLGWRKPPPAPAIPPAIRATQALARISGSVAERFDAVETIVRAYLADAHGIPGGRTAAEIEGTHAGLAAVLRCCERGRFSPAPASSEDLEEASRLARAAFAEVGEAGESGRTAKSG